MSGSSRLVAGERPVTAAELRLRLHPPPPQVLQGGCEASDGPPPVRKGSRLVSGCPEPWNFTSEMSALKPCESPLSQLGLQTEK